MTPLPVNQRTAESFFTLFEILEASYSLIQEKDIQQITINEIAERANINRGTFYLHFLDKYDMMDTYENEMIQKIETIILKNIPKEQFSEQFLPSRFDTILQVLKCFKESKLLLQVLMNSSYNISFRKKLRKSLSSIFDDEILNQLKTLTPTIPSELMVNILVSIILDLGEYSYHSEDDSDIEQLAEFIFKLGSQGPAKALGYQE